MGFPILQPEICSFCRQQCVSSEAVEAATVSWASPWAWQQNICFVLLLGEAGGCQRCSPVGSAGCHLCPVQEMITDSCQTPSSSFSPPLHPPPGITLASWHCPDISQWCQLSYASSIRHHTAVSATKWYSKSKIMFYPLMTPTVCILQNINAEKLQIQVRGNRQHFFPCQQW